MKKVSVIIPVYNVEDYLERCVNSVLNQTYKNLEIILIDDGSTDSCPRMCEELKLRDERIKVIHKKNGGLSDARNCGLDNSTGDFISFIDSDDVIYDKMYENMIGYLQRENAEVCSCEFSRFIEGSVANFSITNRIEVYSSRDEALINLLNEKITNHVCNKVFKRELFNDVRFPVGKYYEDIMVTYKILSKIKKMVATKDQYYGYMYRKESITGGCSTKSVIDYINSINTRYSALINNLNLQEELTVSKLRDIYTLFIKVTINGDKNLINDVNVNEEYIFFKRHMTVKRFLKFIKNDNLKTKILKILLLIDKNVFINYKIRKKD